MSRCKAHGMMPGLCPVRGCTNYDGGVDALGIPLRKRHRRPNNSKSIRASHRVSPTNRERARRNLDMLGPSPLPATRGECAGGHRPCPLVSCRYHLYLDVSPATGTIKLNFPNLKGPEQLAVSCVLDAAEAGGLDPVDVAKMLNVTRQRVDQVERKALALLEGTPALTDWRKESA